MKCSEYERYWFGKISEGDFAAHRASCTECREASEADAAIENVARSQPGPRPAPELWARIVAGIEADEAGRAHARPAGAGERFWQAVRTVLGPPARPAWQYAAVLAVLVGVSFLLLFRPPGPPADTEAQNLLTARALGRVEALEDEYADAIADLEQLAGPALESADAGLRLRYRKRLEVIDDQIRRCQAVLAQDSGNAHVRRYLLAAYQDKKETLVAILDSVEKRPPAGRS